MSSRDSLETRQIAARGTIKQVSDDTPVAIRLKYIGTGTVTSVTVTTATNIVIITSDGGTDTYAFATYDTVGEVADAIDGDTIFEARVLDALRSEATDGSQFVDGAITAGTGDGNGASYYDVLDDTSVSDHLDVCLTPDRNTPSAGAAIKQMSTHRVHLQEITYNVTSGGGADTNGLRIYDRNYASGNTETLIWQMTPTSGSSTTKTWASGQAKITAKEGHELVIKVLDATSITGSLEVAGIIE